MRATRKALVRARQIAAVCAVLAVGAAGSAIFGYVNMKRAQNAELKAQQTRAMAESARGEAEKLIVYLLDDFYLELEPIGRLDIVAGLAKRAVDYYAALPPELRSAETDRNRALALVRYGGALRTESKLDEAGKALAEAVAVLDKLRREGDQSETTAIGLGLGLMSEARVRDSLAKRMEALPLAQQAVDVLKPRMAGASPSVALRRAYGAVLLYLGYSQANRDQEDDAIAMLEAARATYRSIDDLQLGDLPSAASYAEASAWQTNVLVNMGRLDQARRVGDEGIRVAGQVLDRRPGYMPALRARALLGDTLAGAELGDLHERKALAWAEQAASDWHAFVKLDPGNQVAWNNLAAALGNASYANLSLGQVHTGLEKLRTALAIEPNVKASGMIGVTLSITSGYLATVEADAGNRQAAESALADNRRFIAMAVGSLPPDSYARAYLPEYLGWYGYSTMGYGGYAPALAAGEYETVRTLARASLRRLEQLKPPDAEQVLDRKRLLDVAYRTLADASYSLKDYAEADTDIKRALEMRSAIPKRTLFDQRDVGNEQMLAAMIAARLGRNTEAQQIIEPVLKFQRELYARKDNEDFFQHIEFAQTLYASALCAPEQRTAQLTQAAAIMDGLPPEIRQLASTKVLRQRIAEEQRGRH